MKNFCRLATLALALCVIATTAVAQAPATVLSNLVDGVGPIAGGYTNWAGVSELALISGSSLLGVKSTQAVLYVGFFGGNTWTLATWCCTRPRGTATRSSPARK